MTKAKKLVTTFLIQTKYVLSTSTKERGTGYLKSTFKAINLLCIQE